MVRTGGKVRAGQHRHDREGAALRRDHRARSRRPRLGAVAQQRRHEAVGGGRQDRARGRRRCASTKRPARTSRSSRRWCPPTWRRCIATSSIPIRRCRRPAADWLLEQRAAITGRWCTPRWCRRSSTGGFRYNVIPSEAKATIDVRLHPDEDQSAFLDMVRKVDQRSERRSALGPRALSPGRRRAHRHRGVSRCSKRRPRSTTTRSCCRRWAPARPTCRTSAPRASQCYGIGPALDTEDGAEGLRRAQRSGAHPRERAASLRALPVRRRARAGARAITMHEPRVVVSRAGRARWRWPHRALLPHRDPPALD